MFGLFHLNFRCLICFKNHLRMVLISVLNLRHCHCVSIRSSRTIEGINFFVLYISFCAPFTPRSRSCLREWLFKILLLIRPPPLSRQRAVASTHSWCKQKRASQNNNNNIVKMQRFVKCRSDLSITGRVVGMSCVTWFSIDWLHYCFWVDGGRGCPEITRHFVEICIFKWNRSKTSYVILNISLNDCF